MTRSYALLLLFVLACPVPAAAQWGQEIILSHPQLGSPADARLYPFEIDPATPAIDVLEVFQTWGWTWFVPLRLDLPLVPVCRDIPLGVPGLLAPEDYQIRDINRDGRDDLVFRMEDRDSTGRLLGISTRAFLGTGWQTCQPATLGVRP